LRACNQVVANNKPPTLRYLPNSNQIAICSYFTATLSSTLPTRPSELAMLKLTLQLTPIVIAQAVPILRKIANTLFLLANKRITEQNGVPEYDSFFVNSDNIGISSVVFGENFSRKRHCSTRFA
jgi:hypothetical protein